MVELQRKNDALEAKVDTLVSQKDNLEAMIIKMQDDLIDKMFLGKALQYDDNNKK